MAGELKGHPASIRRHTITTTFGEVEVHPPGATAFVQIINEELANPVRIYFNEDDFTADENFFTLGTTTADNSWEGPLERGNKALRGPIAPGGSDQPLFPAKNPGIFARSVGGDSDCAFIFYRVRS